MSTYTRLNLGESKKTVVFRPEKNSPTLLRYKKREKKFALFLQETMTLLPSFDEKHVDFMFGKLRYSSHTKVTQLIKLSVNRAYIC